MEPQRRSDQIDDGWRCLQLNAGEIAVSTEVALILRMSPRWVRLLVRDGKLKASRLGHRTLRYDPADVQAMLLSQRSPA